MFEYFKKNIFFYFIVLLKIFVLRVESVDRKKNVTLSNISYVSIV